MDGTAQERDLLNALGTMGWTGIRSPASGTQPGDAPDILMAKGGVVIAGELKSGGPPRNPTEDEVFSLKTFAEDFDAAAVIVARFKGDRTFYFAPPQALDRTDDGNYSIPGDPERFPYSASLAYSKTTEDGVTAYQVNPSQQDLPADIAGENPLRAWTQNVAQAQLLGADQALRTLGDGDGDGDD